MDDFSHAFLIWWSMTPRLAMTTVTWIMEGMTPKIDRKRSDDLRKETLFWRLKKFAGNIADDLVYRTDSAVIWAFGSFGD